LLNVDEEPYNHQPQSPQKPLLKFTFSKKAEGS